MSIHKYTTTSGTRYRVRWRDAHGKLQSKTAVTIAEARIIEAQTTLGTLPTPTSDAPTGSTLLGAWIVDWFRLNAASWSITTRKQRKHICDRWIFPYLSDQPVETIRRRTILEYRTRILEEGATEKVTNQVLAVLSSCLTSAVDHDLIEHNPILGMRRLRTLPTQRRALTVDEVEEIRHWMPTSRDQVMVSLLAYAGLRPAELCALKWRHITDNFILVEQTAQSGQLQPTKTGASRSVRVCDELRKDIEAYGRGAESDLVVCGERGGILHYKNWFRRVWRPAAKYARVDAAPYDLRHTFVSLCLHSGMTIPEVSQAVGHANATMTLNRYAHVYAESQHATRQTLDEAIRAVRTRRAAKRRHAEPALA